MKIISTLYKEMTLRKTVQRNKTRLHDVFSSRDNQFNGTSLCNIRCSDKLFYTCAKAKYPSPYVAQ